MKLKTLSLLFIALLIFSKFLFAQDMSVESPYVRAIPPGQTISAAFMLLKNSSDVEIALIKADSDIADAVELHEHIKENGMMKMRQVTQIAIAANGETALKPGGYHIMLIGLKKEIKLGDEIDITLSFDNDTQQTIKAKVKKIAMNMTHK